MPEVRRLRLLGLCLLNHFERVVVLFAFQSWCNCCGCTSTGTAVFKRFATNSGKGILICSPSGATQLSAASLGVHAECLRMGNLLMTEKSEAMLHSSFSSSEILNNITVSNERPNALASHIIAPAKEYSVVLDLSCCSIQLSNAEISTRKP